MSRTRWRSIVRQACMALAAVTVAGCFQQPLPDLSGFPDQPSDFPMRRYQGLAAEGWAVHGVDESRSRLVIYVYRGGRMKRLGHNHVISAGRIGGLAALKNGEFTTDLYVPVAELEVDNAALRSQAGPDFDSDLSAEDKQDTRANMLSPKVLNAAEHPFLKAGLTFTDVSEGGGQYTVGLSILGNRRPVTVPMDVRFEDDAVVATGRFALRQSDFGMVPFSILGGAVAVQDELEIEFELTFVPPPPI